MASCSHHCGACGKHFRSLQAFDMHRQGDHGTNDPEFGRRCVDPLDVLNDRGEMRLELADEHGTCRIYAPVDDVKVWTVAGAEERSAALSARFGRTRAEPREEASEPLSAAATSSGRLF